MDRPRKYYFFVRIFKRVFFYLISCSAKFSRNGFTKKNFDIFFDDSQIFTLLTTKF